MTTDLSASVLEVVKRLAEKATPGKREYRPTEYDDWGVVRLPGGRFFAKVNSVGDLDAHRAAKTDPCEADGKFIATVTDPAFVLGLIQEVERLRIEVGLRKSQAARVHICSGCRGKQPTDGECIICYAERHERTRTIHEMRRTDPLYSEKSP